MLKNILNFVFEKSKFLLLPTFVSFRKLFKVSWFYSQILRDTAWFSFKMQKLNETLPKVEVRLEFHLVTNHRGITWDSIAPTWTQSLKH